MLKKSLLFALTATVALGASAEVLTPEAAFQRAKSQQGGRRIAGSVVAPKLAYTAKTAAGLPAVYVFNTEGNGSLIVSASDVALPVLGYTDSGSFDPTNVPPQMQYWLDQYAAQIEWAEENNIKPKDTNFTFSYPTDWTFIAPLVKTKWDQGRPYNNMLENPGFATGCVATAMAQIMKYHEYPEIGHGSISYTDAFGQSFSMNFEQQPFDWANMIDDYSTTKYTTAQANAVAYLMKACGYSTQMTYGSASGTQVEQAATALLTYFGYDQSLRSLQRNHYSTTEWATMLYDNLKNIGPVLYTGSALGYPPPAHAFVADGYDGNGYFHINWGWSGMCDGYYSLDALNPAAQGAGGTSYGGFNFTQGMLVNIQKSIGTPTYEPEAEFTLLGNMSGINTGSMLTLSMTQAYPGNLINSSMVPINRPAFAIEIQNSETGEIASYEDVTTIYFGGDPFNIPTMNPGSYIDPQMSVRTRFNTSLPDGKYKVTLVWRQGSEPDNWQHFRIPSGCHDYVYITKAGTTYTIENMPYNRLVIDKAEPLSPIYMRNPCEISFTVTNPSDSEITQAIIPVLFYEGKLSFEGDSQLITVGPNETVTQSMVYTFSQSGISGAVLPTTTTPKEYTLGAYDYTTFWIGDYLTGNYGESYYGDFGTVMVSRSASNPTIALKSMSIENAVGEETVGTNQIFSIDDTGNIALNVEVEGTRGFVASPLSVVISEIDLDSSSAGPVVDETEFEHLLYVAAGEVYSATTHLSMRDFDPTKLYQITVYYALSNNRYTLGSILFAASSGVEDVTLGQGLDIRYDGLNTVVNADSALASVAVFDISGKNVAAPACNGRTSVSIGMQNLPAGIYLVKATDVNGNSKTLKVCK